MGPNTEGRVIHELEIPVTPTERRELSGTLPPDTKRYNQNKPGNRARLSSNLPQAPTNSSPVRAVNTARAEERF